MLVSFDHTFLCCVSVPLAQDCTERLSLSLPGSGSSCRLQNTLTRAFWLAVERQTMASEERWEIKKRMAVVKENLINGFTTDWGPNVNENKTDGRN